MNFIYKKNITENDLKIFMKKLSLLLCPNLIIFLNGDVGVGKTVLCRELIYLLGYNGHIVSPTYTLIEDYIDLYIPVYHFDLYRLKNINDIYLLGIREYMFIGAICLIEWANKFINILPISDINIKMEINVNNIKNRNIYILGVTSRGNKILQGLL